MKRRVVVTGLGAVTSLGCKVDELWTRICNGESGVGPLTRFDASQFRVRFGGEITQLVGRRLHRAQGRQAVRPLRAVRPRRRHRRRDATPGIDFSKEDPFRCGVILGSGIGGLETIEVQHERLLDKGPGQGLRLHHPQADRQRRQRAALDPVRPARAEPGRRHRLRQRHQRHRRRLQADPRRRGRRDDHRRQRGRHHATSA